VSAEGSVTPSREPGRCYCCGARGPDHADDGACTAARLQFYQEEAAEQEAEEKAEVRRLLLAALRERQPAASPLSFWETVIAIVVALLIFPYLKALLAVTFELVQSGLAFFGVRMQESHQASLPPPAPHPWLEAAMSVGLLIVLAVALVVIRRRRTVNPRRSKGK